MKDLNLLGYLVRDRVTGFEGIVMTIAYDLPGCIQAVVQPVQGKDKVVMDAKWFDSKRLEVLSKKPVMAQPQFGAIPTETEEAVLRRVRGPIEKPSRERHG